MTKSNVLLLFLSVLWMLGVGTESKNLTDDEFALQESHIAPLKVNLYNILIWPDKQKFVLLIRLNMCFGCSKEPFHRDGSFEYPQHLFWLRNKKNNFLLRSLISRTDHRVNVIPRLHISTLYVS